MLHFTLGDNFFGINVTFASEHNGIPDVGWG